MINATDNPTDGGDTRGYVERVRHGSHEGSVDEDNFDHRRATHFLKTLNMERHGEKHANDIAGAPKSFRTVFMISKGVYKRSKSAAKI